MQLQMQMLQFLRGFVDYLIRIMFIVLEIIWIQPKLDTVHEDDDIEDIGFKIYAKMFTNTHILIVIGAIWVSTSAMAFLEPCLPIWLMENIQPEVSYE